MIKSMTGYGRAQRQIGGWEITVEIRSVNHRYFEFSPRISRSCSYLEDKLKAYVQRQISRGKVDLNLQILRLEGSAGEVKINHNLARSYLQALRDMGKELELQDDVTVVSLARFSEIFTIQKAVEDEEYLWECVRTVTEEAVSHFLEMRAQEGDRLQADVLSRAGKIRQLVEQVKKRSPQTVCQYRERLTRKMQEVLEDTRVDEQRILTEAAIFAEKIAVDEETVRLESHLEALKGFLESEDPVGRKLDFLVQEMNREINTIGSKAQDLEITRMVVEMKSEAEKIREQIQNIE